MDDDDLFFINSDDDTLNADHVDGLDDSDFTLEDDLYAANKRHANFDEFYATDDALAAEIEAEDYPLESLEEALEFQEIILQEDVAKNNTAKPSSTVATTNHQKEAGVIGNKDKEQQYLGIAEMAAATTAGIYLNEKRIALNKELQAKELGGEPITFGDRAKQGLTLAGCIGAAVAFMDGASRTFTNASLSQHAQRLMQAREHVQAAGVNI